MRNQRHIELDDFSVILTAPGEPTQTAAEHLLLQLADKIRVIYVNCFREAQNDAHYGREPMPQWDGGEDRFGRQVKPIWPRIAQRVIEIGAEPISFVRAQFWRRGSETRPPAPNYLLSDAAVARYRTYLAEATLDAQKEYERDLNMVQGEVLLVTSGLGWDYRSALRYVLLNITVVRVSALFRFVLAAREGLSDVAQRFHDSALLQYVFQQDLFDAAWGHIIPDPLRQEGAALRAQILGRQ